mgnify:CR=1 FL=1
MSAPLADYKDKNAEIVGYIEEFNKVEEELTYQLAYARTKDDRSSIEKSIAIIQTSRNNLANALGGMNVYYTSNLENSSQTLAQQTEAVAIIDREMQLAKARLDYINKQKANKLRVVEVNQYYGAAYRERTTLVKWIVAGIVVAVIFTYIKKLFGAFAPDLIWNIVAFFAITFFAYNILMVILSLSARSKMVYDEYNWTFDKDSAPYFDADRKWSNPFKMASLGGCVNDGCCHEGTTWDTETSLCVPNVSSLTSKCSPAPAE